MDAASQKPERKPLPAEALAQRLREVGNFVKEPGTSKDRLCRVVVLGVAQDGGVPQLGCSCPHCHAARALGVRRLAAALAVASQKGNAGGVLLVDATPDLRLQVEGLEPLAKVPRLKPGSRSPFDAILLTHVHMGHLAGLLEFGPEVLDARGVDLYCTGPVARVLTENAPWSLLVRRGNLDLQVIAPGVPFQPLPGLTVEAVPVPHRNEFGDTVGYALSAPPDGKTLLYIPDADTWEGVGLTELAGRVDYALLDATFFDHHELPGLVMRRVPHPPVKETAGLLECFAPKVTFIHINHTNPILDPGSAHTRFLAQRGFTVATEGMIFDLIPGRSP